MSSLLGLEEDWDISLPVSGLAVEAADRALTETQVVSNSSSRKFGLAGAGRSAGR
jgi:hypothetical protein